MHACFVVAFSLLFASATSLQCYLGYALLRGSTIGNGTKTCGRDSDYCYYASASIFSLTTFQKAGCNSLICQFIPPQRCFKQSFFGMPVNFCCCRDKDLCNGEDMTESRLTHCNFSGSCPNEGLYLEEQFCKKLRITLADARNAVIEIIFQSFWDLL